MGEKLNSQTSSCRAKIEALVACVPATVVANDSLLPTFGSSLSQVIRMTGVRERRVAPENCTASDLCQVAAEAIPADQLLEVDALIFLSQTPDYCLPSTACLLQDKLGLRKGIIAFDVNLGCSGYPYALWLGSMMIDSGAARKVLLLVGDTVSKTVHSLDRSTALLFGDAGTATLLSSSDDPSWFVLGTDGSGAGNLVVPKRGFRTNYDDKRNMNPPDRLFMEGSEVFSFTISAVPALMAQLSKVSGYDVADLDRVYFHQANKFMIDHLKKKIGASDTQTPMNISEFGNTSCASIPLLIAGEDGSKISSGSLLSAMLGFGVGYSWAGAMMRVGPLSIAKVVEYTGS